MHTNEEFLLTMTRDELDNLVAEAASLGVFHVAALSEQIHRLGLIV